MLGFNPRARAGRDGAALEMQEILHSFNPRARAGRDPSILYEGMTFSSFNPRARAGRDLGFFSNRAHSIVSIHAPARGATISSE